MRAVKSGRVRYHYCNPVAFPLADFWEILLKFVLHLDGNLTSVTTWSSSAGTPAPHSPNWPVSTCTCPLLLILCQSLVQPINLSASLLFDHSFFFSPLTLLSTHVFSLIWTDVSCLLGAWLLAWISFSRGFWVFLIELSAGKLISVCF